MNAPQVYLLGHVSQLAIGLMVEHDSYCTPQMLKYNEPCLCGAEDTNKVVREIVEILDLIVEDSENETI
jgi:hypothetical protein